MIELGKVLNKAQPVLENYNSDFSYPLIFCPALNA